ncbi:uncharacterized protein B0H18DRAFT_1083730 [Fomitopsis serialis]|uniref:uncharacterized protein n=1 Tax=Fomitopsis serialis TaxID=139415 RepID=UPI00200848A7|nr:uncharacterized protein B0H18DRAFT_1083730 [Neoantrodia serialis]KAH9930614.1 hypothetical protein B0H18DRAFT_1083730 [Neoantrodia serialis]
MYEEVCLLCGRPVSVDGRAYCSDECESLDTASPSISTSSSALASPYLRSNNGPGSLADVPALHKNRHSISSSSTSSAIWSVSTDEEDELASAGPDEDLLPGSGTESAKPADPFLYPFQPRGAGLSYARRPSGTNQRSTVPTLNRHTSATSSPFAGTGSPRSAPPPYSPAEEEFPDVPQTSTSIRSAGPHGRGRRNRSSFASDPSSEQEIDHETTVTSKPKRNRASLPAYFSLLTTSTSSPTPPRAHGRPPPADSHSDHAVLPIITSHTPRRGATYAQSGDAFSQVHFKPQPGPSERGRGRKRDSEARSASSRRSTQRSPPRQSRARASPSRSPPPCAHHRVHIGSQARARLDSIEKVADWVSNSPAIPVRGRALTRRNSSPPATEEDDIAAVREVLAKSLHFHPDHDDIYVASRDRRGRRRPDELDQGPVAVDGYRAPGYGAGRSGLISRDCERERGRPSRGTSCLTYSLLSSA